MSDAAERSWRTSHSPLCQGALQAFFWSSCYLSRHERTQLPHLREFWRDLHSLASPFFMERPRGYNTLLDGVATQAGGTSHAPEVSCPQGRHAGVHLWVFSKATGATSFNHDFCRSKCYFLSLLGLISQLVLKTGKLPAGLYISMKITSCLLVLEWVRTKWDHMTDRVFPRHPAHCEAVVSPHRMQAPGFCTQAWVWRILWPPLNWAKAIHRAFWYEAFVLRMCFLSLWYLKLF
jgi:hypothetical protein